MPTVQATDDFNHAIDAGYYTDGLSGSPSAVTSPLYQSQPKTLRLVTNGGSGLEGVTENLTGSPTMPWMGFAFQTSLVSQLHQVAHIWATGFSESMAISMGSTGIFLNVGGNSTAETAISASTWYWVEAIYDLSVNPHKGYLRVEGVDFPTATGPAAAATTGLSVNVFIQFTPAGTNYYYGIWKYGSASSTTDWLGEPSAEKQSFYASRRRTVARR